MTKNELTKLEAAHDIYRRGYKEKALTLLQELAINNPNNPQIAALMQEINNPKPVSFWEKNWQYLVLGTIIVIMVLVLLSFALSQAPAIFNPITPAPSN